VFKLITLDDFVLFENLERVLLLIVFLDDEEYFSVGALAND
jgi:hypothetical protein